MKTDGLRHREFSDAPDYADGEYVDEPVMDLLVAEVERSRGYWLPRSECICRLPSAGHDMFCLDRDCAAARGPKVVHVDQEWDYRITVIADTFDAFIRGLDSEHTFEAV